MQEIIKLLIGGIILIMGYFIGNLLASNTKSELKKNQKWFKIIVIISLIGGFIGLFIKNDVILNLPAQQPLFTKNNFTMIT